MSAIAIVYALYGNAAAAERAAREAVEQRLAACANVLASCTSFYIWEGAPEKQSEIPVLFKTTAARRDALMAHLSATHDYDVPAVLSWDLAATTPDFARWTEEAVSTG